MAQRYDGLTESGEFVMLAIIGIGRPCTSIEITAHCHERIGSTPVESNQAMVALTRRLREAGYLNGTRRNLSTESRNGATQWEWLWTVSNKGKDALVGLQRARREVARGENV